MLNCVQLCGRLTADPESRTTGGGKHVATFTIAIPKRYANPESTDTADFFRCVAWTSQADYVNDYLTKGRLVALNGRLQSRKYNASDGSTREIVEVVVDHIQGLDRPRDAQPEAVPNDLDTFDPFEKE